MEDGQRQNRRGLATGGLFFFETIFLLALVATSVPGVVLAIRALREIRGSGGKLAGLSRARFSVLAWLALPAGFFGLGGIFTLFADNGVPPYWRNLLAALLLATSALGVMTIRQFIRWTRDSSASAPDIRRHVWRFVAAVFLAGVCVIAYVREEKATRNSYGVPTGNRATIKMNILPGKMVEFRIVRIDVSGKETPLGIEGRIPAPVSSSIQADFTVSTTERWKQSPRQEIVVRCETASGEIYRKSAFLDDQWKFPASAYGQSQMFSMKQDRMELATRSNWLGKTVETLYFETIASTHTETAPALEKQP